MLNTEDKATLPVALGHMIASSPLESLVMPGDQSSQGVNVLQGHMAAMFPVRKSSATTLPLHCVLPFSSYLDLG